MTSLQLCSSNKKKKSKREKYQENKKREKKKRHEAVKLTSYIEREGGERVDEKERKRERERKKRGKALSALTRKRTHSLAKRN